MDMKEVNGYLPIKFLIVLGKLSSSAFEKANKQIKELGFSQTEFLILYAIASNGALTIQDIAARISVTSGNMTYTIDKLEKKGLIQRIHCAKDRRKIFVDFTEEGKKRWESAIAAHMKQMENFFDLEEATLEATIEAMKAVGKSLEENR